MLLQKSDGSRERLDDQCKMVRRITKMHNERERLALYQALAERERTDARGGLLGGLLTHETAEDRFNVMSTHLDPVQLSQLVTSAFLNSTDDEVRGALLAGLLERLPPSRCHAVFASTLQHLAELALTQSAPAAAAPRTGYAPADLMKAYVESLGEEAATEVIGSQLLGSLGPQVGREMVHAAGSKWGEAQLIKLSVEVMQGLGSRALVHDAIAPAINSRRKHSRDALLLSLLKFFADDLPPLIHDVRTPTLHFEPTSPPNLAPTSKPTIWRAKK